MRAAQGGQGKLDNTINGDTSNKFAIVNAA